MVNLVNLSYGQRQRLRTLCQNSRKPAGIREPKWDDLSHGYLSILDEIDIDILREALGQEFLLAMTPSQDELKQ